MGRSHLFSSTALAGLLVAPSAFAADLAPVPYRQSEGLQWSGFYLGANGGYAWSQDPGVSCTSSLVTGSPCNTTPPSTFQAPTASGAEFGLQAGYNWQVANWVFGFEADINKLAAQGSTQFPSIDPSKGTDATTSRYDWLGTARGRVGVVEGNALFYATGGFAYGRVGQQYVLGLTSNNTQSFDTSGNRMGWTVGGGVDYGLDQHWSLRAEYLYVSLDNSNLDISGVKFTGNFGTPAAPGTSFLHFNNNLNILRLGMNYRF
jgi:outer membrane immunogenic protein